jgi:hypothetical protein
MMNDLKWAKITLSASLALILVACAATTAYRGIPVATLNDQQLVEELYSAAAGLGIELSRTAYLMAVRPDPAYVLTSSTTTFSGSANARYNAYVMPVGYGASVSGTSSGTVSGAAVTRYQYTDVNAAARLGNAIGQAISRSRQQAYRRRGLEVLDEYQQRVTQRRVEAEHLLQEFFEANPELNTRRTLVAAVAPWAAAEGFVDARATLKRTQEIINDLQRGDGLSGRWYGTLAQTTTTTDGDVIAFSEFVRLDLEQVEEQLSGNGTLGTGELLELSGTVHGTDVAAAVANITSGINVKLTALAAPSQITGEYTGFGAGMHLEGTFTLLR